MDPEEWTGIMNRAFDLLTPTIYRYEGTIARLMGDALLAFFGAPVAHEDDPVRAVHASLDILDAAQEYAQQIQAEYGIHFAVRVGLNTGFVVVGAVGSDLVYEYTAMGDAVNLAQRMQSAASPMSIWITEYTYRFVEPFFNCQDLGTISVKGKVDPVHAYQVLDRKATPGRTRGLTGLESPMVGRETEMAALRQVSEALMAGLGRLAVISGEPGLGKSRLIAEWKSSWFDSPAGGSGENQVTWVEGHCLSYGQGMAYHLLVDVLRCLIDVSSTSPQVEVSQALERLVTDQPDLNFMDVYPYLAHLLSLPLEGPAMERIQQLDPQALQTQYLSALRYLLRSLSRQKPIVLVLEDIHWADPSSTELLVKLLPECLSAPILIACVTRPERDAPGWKLVTAAREVMGGSLVEISLAPLSEIASRQLVSNLLEIEALPGSIRDSILVKAEGNPFFVEEVIRMLIDREAIVRQNGQWTAVKEIETVEIPDNLHSLLLARIDRLPEEVKHTLRVASVIGRQFSVNLLEQVLKQ
jgi:class 3 adenylate cyclase